MIEILVHIKTNPSQATIWEFNKCLQLDLLETLCFARLSTALLYLCAHHTISPPQIMIFVVYSVIGTEYNPYQHKSI